MKPQLLKVSTGPVQSFSVRRDDVPFVNNRWHYHREIELIHFEKGHGTQFIGDNIRAFNSGDVVLVGSNLPHYWRFDDTYFEGQLSADVRVVHFSESFWGEAFLSLPENKKIKDLLERAKQGVLLSGREAKEIAKKIEELLSAEGARRITLLLEALTSIADSRECSLLSSIGFSPVYEEGESERLNAVYEFSISNLKRRITIQEVATIANVRSTSFCRFFKQRTRKTYSEFMIELRVGEACRLLIENRMSIKQVCYESGFHNLSSFYRYFKNITGKSPVVYQKEFLNKG